MYNRFFLPYRSSKGPYNNSAADSPMKKLDKVSVTSAVLECRSFPMAANPGKYISIENGPKAAKLPKITISLKCVLFVMSIKPVSFFLSGKNNSSSHLNELYKLLPVILLFQNRISVLYDNSSTGLQTLKPLTLYILFRVRFYIGTLFLKRILPLMWKNPDGIVQKRLRLTAYQGISPVLKPFT